MSSRSKFTNTLLTGSIWKSKENDPCCPSGSGGDFVLHIDDTPSIDLEGQGTQNNPLVGNVKVSNDDGNIVEIHSDGVYVSATQGQFVESVTSGDNNITVDNTDPFNPVISSAFQFSILKQLQDRTRITYYKLPKNFYTQGVEDITRNGALSTATITAVGANDKFVVTGGTSSSYLTFNDRIVTDSGARFRVLIKAESLGTGALMGIRVQNNPSYYTIVQGNATMYLTVQTSQLNVNIGTGSYPPGADYNTGGTPFSITSGDIIEMIIERNVQIQHSWLVIIINQSTGKFITMRKDAAENMANIAQSAANPGLILADGTYTILDYEILSQDGEGSKCCIISNCTGVGYNVIPGNTIVGYLNNQLIYRNTVLGGMGTNIEGFVRGSVPELLLLRPQTNVIIDFWSIYFGYFKPANGNNANFLEKLGELCDAIKSFGGKPIFVKYKDLSAFISAPDVALWNTWVDTNAASYGALILDLTSGPAGTYDNLGNSFDAPYTYYIGDQIIALLTANGYLP